MIFELTENHLKLIARMYVDWNDEAYEGAPGINVKRPYGNSFVAGDVAEIVYGADEVQLIMDDNEGELPSNVYDDCMALHRETETALQIVLCTRSFVPGKYARTSPYNDRSWKLVE